MGVSSSQSTIPTRKKKPVSIQDRWSIRLAFILFLLWQCETLEIPPDVLGIIEQEIFSGPLLVLAALATTGVSFFILLFSYKIVSGHDVMTFIPFDRRFVKATVVRLESGGNIQCQLCHRKGQLSKPLCSGCQGLIQVLFVVVVVFRLQSVSWLRTKSSFSLFRPRYLSPLQILIIEKNCIYTNTGHFFTSSWFLDLKEYCRAKRNFLER